MKKENTDLKIKSLCAVISMLVFFLLPSSAVIFAQSLPARVVGKVAVPATSNNCVDVNSSTNCIYASGGASGGQTLTIINGNTNTVVTTVTGSIAHVNPKTNRVYAGQLSPSAILVYDGSTGASITSIPVSGCAIEAYVDTSINRVWGAAQCGSGGDPVFIINGGDNSVQDTISSGGIMGGLAVNPVTHFAYIYPSGPPKRINPATGAVEAVSFSGYLQVVNPVTNVMYATTGSNIEVIDGNTGGITTLLNGTGSLAINQFRNRLYVADNSVDSLRVYDTQTNSQLVTYGFPQTAHAGSIAVNTQTGLIYLISNDTVYAMKDDFGTFIGEYGSDANTALLLHMNEAGGTNLADASDNGNNGTAIGTSDVGGRFGRARSFNGSSDYISLPVNVSLQPNLLTLEAWINPSEVSGPMFPIIAAGGVCYRLYIVNSAVAFDLNTGTINSISTGPILERYRWYHVAAVYDGARMIIYLNGTRVAIGAASGNINYDGVVNGINIGYYYGSPSYYRGSIDEVRISNIARTPNDFNLQRPPANLAASVSGNDVYLNWNNGGGQMFMRYRIYQGPDSNSLAPVGATVNANYTKTVWGGTYYYRVTALDSTGFESMMSRAAQAVVPAPALSMGEYQSDPSTRLLLHMNEGTGNTVMDASAFSNDGIASSYAVVDNGGRFNNARLFTSQNGPYVSIKYSPSLNLNNGCTIEAWLGGADYSQERVILKKYNGTSGYKLYTSYGKAAFYISDQSGGSVTLTGTSNVAMSGWKHIALTGDSSMIRLYVNGVEEASIVPSMLNGPSDNTDSLVIGFDGVEELSGLVDEVRILSRICLPQEFNLQLPPAITSTYVSGQNVYLVWNNGGGGVPLKNYRIYRGLDSSNVSILDSSFAGAYQDAATVAGTAYFYRVTAVDSTGHEGAMSYAVMNTIPGGSSPPSAPTNLQTQSLGQTILLNWTDNSNNEDGFEIQRGLSSANFTDIFTVTANQDYFYDNNSLAMGTRYYYRVRAYNTVGGYSNFTAIQSDTTSTIDLSLPDIIDYTDPVNLNVNVTGGAGQPVSISASAYDPDGIMYFSLWYSRYGFTDSTEITFSAPYSATSVTIPAQAFVNNGTANGVSYKLMAIDNGNHRAYTKWRPIVVKSGSNVTSPFALPSASALSDNKYRAYRIVSVPYDLDEKRPSIILPNSFGNHGDGNVPYARWRLQNRLFQDYEVFMDQPAFRPGNAFFLIMNNGGNHMIIGPGAVVNSDTMSISGIPMNSGWNLVGDPFNVSVRIDNTLFQPSVPGGVIQQTAMFTGSGPSSGWLVDTINSRVVAPWGGVAVRVSTPGRLCFNVTGGKSSLGKQAASKIMARITPSAQQDAMNWMIPLDAERIDNGSCSKGNGVGMAKDASSGDDNYDLYMPPFVSSGNVALYFGSSEEPLMRDIKPLNADGCVWEMHLITGDAGTRIKLNFGEKLELPNKEFDAYLIDLDQRMAYDLEKNSSLEVGSGDGSRNFKIVVGKKSFIEKNNAGIRLAPDEMKLYANYPNPFNPETVIRYTIPETSQSYSVLMKVYNLLGQEVATLVNGKHTPGYYEVKWNAADRSSGVYFYRISISDGNNTFNDIKKMILMK